MPRNWLGRAKLVVLAALLFTGGGGLPVLDVLLFHAHASAHSPTPHFESSGSSHAHSDHCRLGTTVSHTPVPVRLGFAIPVVGLSFLALPTTRDVPLSAAPRLLPQPRAPPAATA